VSTVTPAGHSGSVAPLARASTLPSRLYLEPAVLELERERIFSRTWQLVAHWSDLARNGGLRSGLFGLQPVRVERFGPFVFVDLADDAAPLADVLGAIP